MFRTSNYALDEEHRSSISNNAVSQNDEIRAIATEIDASNQEQATTSTQSPLQNKKRNSYDVLFDEFSVKPRSYEETLESSSVSTQPKSKGLSCSPLVFRFRSFVLKYSYFAIHQFFRDGRDRDLLRRHRDHYTMPQWKAHDCRGADGIDIGAAVPQARVPTLLRDLDCVAIIT
jgi:hypothetical protein